jgi:hypothetical protein
VLLGAVPVEMVIERNMLSTFMNIARNKLSVEYHILSRELAMKNENRKIFINRIQEILEKYGLGYFVDLPCKFLSRTYFGVT